MKRFGVLAGAAIVVASIVGSASPAFAVFQNTGNGGFVIAGGEKFPSATGGFGEAEVVNPQGKSFQGGFGSGTTGFGCGSRINVTTGQGSGGS